MRFGQTARQRASFWFAPKKPKEVLRVSIGPITSATLRECGYPAHAEAREASVASLADGVREAVQAHNHG